MEKEKYGKIIGDAKYWERYVNQAMKSLEEKKDFRNCKLDNFSIESGFVGSYPTMIVDIKGYGKVVIKFFIKNCFDGFRIFTAERKALEFVGKLNLTKIPKVLDVGEIVDNYIGMELRYIVMDFMEGICIRELIEKRDLSYANYRRISFQLGEIVAKIHNSPLKGYDRTCLSCFSSSSFSDYVLDCMKKAEKRHFDWGILNEKLINELDEYLKKFRSKYFELFCQEKDMVLLHADLTEDHIFVNDAEDDEMNISGVIDFGDVEIAHPAYELIAVFFGVFYCKKELLICFLERYGWNEKFSWMKMESDHFAYYMNCFSLIFEFNIYLRYEKELKKLKSLKDLEDYCWKLKK